MSAAAVISACSTFCGWACGLGLLATFTLGSRLRYAVLSVLVSATLACFAAWLVFDAVDETLSRAQMRKDARP